MILLLGALDNSTVKFPVDIFRDAEVISAVQRGKSYRSVYTYTNVEGRAVIDGPVHAGDLLPALRGAEKQFEEEEASVQDT